MEAAYAAGFREALAQLAAAPGGETTDKQPGLVEAEARELREDAELWLRGQRALANMPLDTRVQAVIAFLLNSLTQRDKARSQALEEAARVVDNAASNALIDKPYMLDQIAAAIRSLKSS